MSKVNIMESEGIDLGGKPPKKPRNSGKKDLIALNEKQREELLSLAYNRNHKHYLILKLALESALRVNEVVNLIVPFIDFVNNRINLDNIEGSKDYLAFKLKSSGSKRIIEMDSQIIKSLKDFIGSRKTGYVFETAKKNSKNKGRYHKNSLINMINKYAKLCKSIGKPIGMHTLRRTFASFLAEEKESASLIKSYLGHQSIATTYKYIHTIHNDKAYVNAKKVLRKMNKTPEKIEKSNKRSKKNENSH